jgi:large subunit ribosomal protein L6
MSRIGKLPITVPEGVTVEITKKEIKVTGPKGELLIARPKYVDIDQKDGSVLVSIPENKEGDKVYRAFHGLTRSLINNMVVGVTDGYKKELEMKGIGYRAALQGDDLVLNVGFSHQVIISKTAGVTFGVTDNTSISVEGTDKVKVGQVAANIRKVRPPEPYKGKGIAYKGEKIRRKSGKSGKGAKGAK